MSTKAEQARYALVSRTFWPVNPAIGEALLLTAEALVDKGGALVITQAEVGFRGVLKEAGRGEGVCFSLMRSWTSSASAMPLRVLELIFFACFVFFSLCYHRPQRVYVATNPPLLVPLVVRWYCRLFNRTYLYHLQDIHPEATTVVTGKNNWIARLLQRIDCATISGATKIITLTGQMQNYIQQRMSGRFVPPVLLLDNPSVQGEVMVSTVNRAQGFVYCGNAGRLQRIPLLLQAIEEYIQQGGSLPFVFAGGGMYAKAVQQLAGKYGQVSYVGVLPAAEAADLMQGYAYGLMPIDDDVTRFAFPSKSSSYVFSGCRVLAICGLNTSVAEWVLQYDLGMVVEPMVDSIVRQFFALEKQSLQQLEVEESILYKLKPATHARALVDMLVEP